MCKRALCAYARALWVVSACTRVILNSRKDKQRENTESSVDRPAKENVKVIPACLAVAEAEINGGAGRQERCR